MNTPSPWLPWRCAWISHGYPVVDLAGILGSHRNPVLSEFHRDVETGCRNTEVMLNPDVGTRGATLSAEMLDPQVGVRQVYFIGTFLHHKI